MDLGKRRVLLRINERLLHFEKQKKSV